MNALITPWDADGGRTSAGDLEVAVDLTLVVELGMLGLDAVQLDSDFLMRNDIHANVEIAIGSCAHAAAQTPIPADTQVVSVRHESNLSYTA